MTKLLNYILNEDEYIREKTFQTIEKECSYYLKKYPDLTLYRGTRKLSSFAAKIKPRKNREPLHSDPLASEALDYATKEIFGWKSRSEGTFVTPLMADAMIYGKAYIFIPIGNSWKYIWSPKVSDSVEITNSMENILHYSEKRTYSHESLYMAFLQFLGDKPLHDKELIADLKHWKLMIDSDESETKLNAMREHLTERVLKERAYTVVKNEYTDKGLSNVHTQEIIFNCQKDGFYLVDMTIYNQWRLEKKKNS